MSPKKLHTPLEAESLVVPDAPSHTIMGKATIMLPFEPAEDKEAEHYSVYYVDENGGLVKVPAEYVDGHMVFSTVHFSDYVIVYEGLTEAVDVTVPAISGGVLAAIVAAAAVVLVVIIAVLARKKKVKAE